MVATWPDERQPALRAKLESGWEWMKNNPNHPGLQSFWERWEAANPQYMCAETGT
jgi:hypothetical protein